VHIVGTAGHVDHGKSALIAALTGVHPDRLKEEIEREMTIELGFAALQLPSGEQIGIVDTPGHRDFIGNMLAGIGGIDAVLLVVAADEGVSAQTREHLDILDLLQVHKGVIVITKTDLISDPEWLELVELEVRELVHGTSLSNIPLVKVSAKTGAGLQELVHALEQVLANTPVKADYNRPRLPVDRVFSLTGFGTIVTGTLLDGTFSVGEEVVCLPSGLHARIRGIQTHNQKQMWSHPGMRTALNLSGIDKSQITRGDVITWLGTYDPTQLLDGSFRYLPSLSNKFEHNTEVKLFIGASETVAQARLLGADHLEPGDEGFLQLRLTSPIVAMRGDRYILRLPSPSQTIGGGSVLDAHPQKLHRRFDSLGLQQLQRLRNGKPAEVLIQALTGLGVSTVADLQKKIGFGENQTLSFLQELVQEKQIIALKPDPQPQKSLIITQSNWEKLEQTILQTLQAFHQAHPLHLGMAREALRSQLKLTQAAFDVVLGRLLSNNLIEERSTLVAKAGYTISFTPSQQAQADILLEKFNAEPYSPPDGTEAKAIVGEDLLQGMIAHHDLVQVSEQILFTPAALEEMTSWVKIYLQENGSLTLAEFRDHFQSSRKYAVAVLEYLDAKGITKRKGDTRVLNQIK
jgi:selenocysteine-specific elongation factor